MMMQVSVVEKEGLLRELTIEVPLEKLDSVVDERLKEVASKASMPGFRSDKPVPIRAVKQRFGKEIRDESANQLMVQSFIEAIKTENLEPAGDPEFEEVVAQDAGTFRFKASFEVIPKLDLKLLNDVKLVKIKAAVVDEDIEKTLQHLREQNRTWKKVDRAAAKGDKVVIDFAGTIDGKPLESGTAENYEVELGSGMMIPGFEDGVVGSKAGDKLELNLKFPKDYHHEEIADKDVTFAVTVHSVEDGALPEIDDEFCKKFQVKDTEELKKNIRKNLDNQAQDIAKSKNKDSALTKLLELNPIVAPNVMVDNEIKRRMSMSREMSGFAANPEQMAAISELMKPDVTRAVQMGLLLRELINKNDIKAESDDVRKRVEELAQNYESPDEYINWFYTDKERVREAEAAVIEDKAVDFLFEHAQFEEKTVNYHELTDMKPAEENKDEE